MVAQIIGTPIHILACELFVIRYELGVKGLGIATMVTYFILFTIVAMYTISIKALRESL